MAVDTSSSAAATTAVVRAEASEFAEVSDEPVPATSVAAEAIMSVTANTYDKAELQSGRFLTVGTNSTFNPVT